MSFVLPKFILPVGIWRAATPLSNPPDVTSVGNLSPGELRPFGLQSGLLAAYSVCQMWLRLPACTDVRDGASPGGADHVEVPQGSGRFYLVKWVDDIGLGFPNEHRFAGICKSGVWPSPIPCGNRPYPPPPPGPLSADGSGSTGLLPANSFTFTMTTAQAGNAWVGVLWGNQPAIPLVNGNSPLAGSVQSVVNGLITFKAAHYWFAKPAGPTTVTVQFPGMAGGYMAAYGMYEAYVTMTPLVGTTQNGVGLTPTAPFVADLFGIPLKVAVYKLVQGGLVIPGEVPSGGYTRSQATALNIPGGDAYMESGYVVLPAGGSPAWAESPALGPWLAWAAEVDQAT